MFAVIETGGKQYKVNEGDIIYVEKLDAAEGQSVTFDRVLMQGQGADVRVGTPYLDGASVTGDVVKDGKNRKIIVFKFKPKKNYKKKQGHRQSYTKVQITGIA